MPDKQPTDPTHMNIIENRQFDRRRYLKGAGVAIALPILESLASSASAAAINKKAVKRVVCLSNNYGVYDKAFFPAKSGADYELSPTPKPLERHRRDFTVFSNLDHGIAGDRAIK